VYSALSKLAEKYHVVVGIYGIHVGPESQVIEVSISDGTLADAFDAIVTQYPQLEWKQASNGAVHFTFRDSPLSLIEVPVSSFDAENPGRMETSGRLAELPEVASWLRNHACTIEEMVAGHIPEEWQKFAVHARTVPFSGLFDEIAAKSGTYAWSAIQYSSEPCAINVGL
jgi:hypothetical protein